MGHPQRVAQISPEEYLRVERTAEYKSEYYAGEIFAMAGATANHNLILANVIGELCRQLKGKRCRAYASDLRMLIPATGLFTYPDASVICGPLEYAAIDERLETVTNPTLIVEVLSDSTEAYDRGTKFAHFRSLPSFAEYVLVSQTEPLVEVFSRLPVGTWELTPVRGLEASAPLRSLQISLALAEVFDGVDFAPTAPLKNSGK